MRPVHHRPIVFQALLALALLAGQARAFVENVEVLPPNPGPDEVVTARVSGHFPDSCWSFLDHKIVSSPGEIQILVQADKSIGPCMDVTVPYSFEAQLVDLSPGAYHLTVTDPQDSKSLDFEVREGGKYISCDANGDGATDISDAVFLLFFLFASGSAPPCKNIADANGDGTIDGSDPVYLLGHLFLGGPRPAARLECLGPRDCIRLPWPIFCTGHWECDCGACRAICDDTTCGDGICDPDGGETPESCSIDCKKDCRPICGAIGTKSEGWYDSCEGKLIRYDNCAQCTAECRECGSKSEGWYDTCTGELILWADCDCVKP